MSEAKEPDRMPGEEDALDVRIRTLKVDEMFRERPCPAGPAPDFYDEDTSIGKSGIQFLEESPPTYESPPASSTPPSNRPTARPRRQPADADAWEDFSEFG